MSISYDIVLPNGKPTRNPQIDPFIDAVCERLHCAIEVYENNPLGKRVFSYLISIKT